MQQQDIIFLKKWFTHYLASFYLLDEDIRKHVALKEEHTYKVMEHSRALAEWLGLAQEDIFLAECIALFHDIGRFEQYKVYRTFVDHKSVDHAQLGLEIIGSLTQLNCLTPEERQLFNFAIANHNTMKLPDGMDVRLELFATMIRDADKLDIYRVLSGQLTAPSPQGYSPAIARDLLAGVQSSYTEMKTPDDRKLMRLSWVYDINYTWTLRRVREAGYIEEILRYLPPTPEIGEVVVKLKRYINLKAGLSSKN